MALPRFSEIVQPDMLRIGSTFQAAQLRESRFDGLLAPIMLVDHFTLSASRTPYPFAGLPAMTYLFEDSVAARHEAEGVGERLVGPGDLHWGVGGRGALRAGQSREGGGNVQGLRIFVAAPPASALSPASTSLTEAAAMPVIGRAGLRVRVVAGASKNVRAAADLPEPVTLLDCFLDPQTRFAHPMPASWNAVIYLVEGNALAVTIDGRTRRLDAGTAIAVGTRGDGQSVVLSTADAPVHAILVSVPASSEIRAPTVSPTALVSAFRNRRVLHFPANGTAPPRRPS